MKSPNQWGPDAILGLSVMAAVTIAVIAVVTLLLKAS